MNGPQTAVDVSDSWGSLMGLARDVPNALIRILVTSLTSAYGRSFSPQANADGAQGKANYGQGAPAAHSLLAGSFPSRSAIEYDGGRRFRV